MPRLDDNFTRYPRPILWLVRGGDAEIGDGEADASPAFRVRLDSFYLSKLPVSNLQFEAFRPEYLRTAGSDDDDPATGVSFDDASAYCEWYAGVARKPLRLPTELEWEYACRAGAGGRWFWGDDPALADAHALHAGNGGGRPGGLSRLRPNGFGLLGMLGGVWEWTSSLYLPYPARPGDGRDGTSATGPRVLRGGSFRTPLEDLGCSRRRGEPPTARFDDAGFRIARSL